MKHLARTFVLAAALGMALSFAACDNIESDRGFGEPGTAKSVNQDHAPSAFDGMPPVGTRARCPVMGGEFEVTANSQHSTFDGKTYVFCCPGCKPQFDADPGKYI